MSDTPSAVHLELERVFHAERGRLLAALIHSCGGDFEVAEDALQEAVVAALDSWPHDLPEKPAAWLLTTARRKAIDALRRDQSWVKKRSELVEPENTCVQPSGENGEWDEIPDERLRLIFTCCHPAIAPEAGIRLLNNRHETSPILP